MNEKTLKLKNNIIDKAAKIIMEKGVKNTSLMDIAKGVGISKGTLYYHFPTKDELIFEITEKNLNNITKNILSLIEDAKNSKESFYEIVYTLYYMIINNLMRSKLHIYLIQEAVTSNPSLIIRFKSKYKEWKLEIANALKSIVPNISKERADVLSMIILSSLDGLVLQSLVGIKEIDIRAISEHICNFAKTNET